MDWSITGGLVLGDAELARRDVHLCGGVIAAKPALGARRFDATGLIVAPGIVDLHGDGFERNFSPRPGVCFDIGMALVETDRQLAANGITTAFLAVTISWEPGLRSLANARRLIDRLARLREELLTDLRVQLRWEVYALDAVDQVEEWLRMEPAPTLAFNDHFSALASDPEKLERTLPEYAQRAGLDAEAYRELTARTAARAGEVPAAIERLARAAAEHGVPMLAHDEPDVATRCRNRTLGIRVSEFPLSREAAEDATAHDEHVVLGAPNVVRGGSHIGALAAGSAIRDGLCTALASDYYYPSLLAAAARLTCGDILNLPSVWPQVAANPAAAAGLTDRGAVRPGLRGDLCVLGYDAGKAEIRASFRGGRLVFAAGDDRLA
ncbi:alpha-D-ribose 1-methylphosphonate 5-triphosphate diphosphatase [Rhodobacteraceae bacterium NNCM2]|nr:alpha-D-ribose 1-methylphosphonate 5-triphosphate diphosphatase [Coraliihabitans acroporae]